MVTDPACPWSWAAEPAIRRVLSEFGDEAAITYVTGGLAREVGDGLHIARETLEAGAWSGMPADPRLWLERPPRSTFPACLAVKAAAEQGRDAALLRVLREGFMLDRRPLDTPDALLQAAREAEGVDVPRFEIDLHSAAITEAFGADLERGRGTTMPRVELADGTVLEGRIAAEELAGAVARAGAQTREAPSVEEALRRFGRMAVPEVAAVCRLPVPRAAAELWRLAAEWRARPERVLGADIWRPA